jgi:hypothetical protein
MKVDDIIKIEVDRKGRLIVKPATAKFLMIYREALEVCWDSEFNFLYTPKPKKWSYLDWYKQIRLGAHRQGVELITSKKTEWINIPDDLQQEMIYADKIKLF